MSIQEPANHIPGIRHLFSLRRHQLRPEALSVSLTLLRSGVSMGLAERAIFAYEGHVQLAESVIERAIVKAENVVGDKAGLFHPVNRY